MSFRKLVFWSLQAAAGGGVTATFIAHTGEEDYDDIITVTHIKQDPAGTEKPPLPVKYEDK